MIVPCPQNTYTPQTPFVVRDLQQLCAYSSSNAMLRTSKTLLYTSSYVVKPIALQTNGNITIISNLFGKGLGDISGAIKMRDQISKAYPDLSVTLVVNKKDWKKIAPFHKAIGTNVICLSEYPPPFVFPPSNLTIHYPFSGDFSFMHELVKYFFKSQAPHLALTEYGKGQMIPFLNHNVQSKRKDKKVVIGSLGADISASELGLLFKPELYDHFKKNLSVEARLNLLSKLPSKLSTRLLGKPYSASAIQQFHQTGKLYFGYSHFEGTKNLFVRVIANLQSNSNTTIHTVLVGEPLAIDTPLIKALRKAKVASIEVHMEGLEQTVITKTMLLSKHGNHLKIYSIHSLANHHMLTLLQASEDETLATGDQTFGDAIIAGKFVLYEKLPHKEELASSLCSRAMTFDQSIGLATVGLFSSFQQASFQQASVTLGTDSYPVYFVEEDVQRGVTCFQSLRSQSKKWKSFVHYLYSTANAFPKIIALIDRFLGR